jgi:hypothetical protein
MEFFCWLDCQEETCLLGCFFSKSQMHQDDVKLKNPFGSSNQGIFLAFDSFGPNFVRVFIRKERETYLLAHKRILYPPLFSFHLPIILDRRWSLSNSWLGKILLTTLAPLTSARIFLWVMSANYFHIYLTNLCRDSTRAACQRFF